MKLDNLERLIDHLPISVTPHIGLEVVNNTATNIPTYPRIQRRVRDWNQGIGLAEVAGSDFHTKYLVGRAFTEIATVDGRFDLAAAFREKNTLLSGRIKTVRDILITVISHASAYKRYKTGNHGTSMSRNVLELIDRLYT